MPNRAKVSSIIFRDMISLPHRWESTLCLFMEWWERVLSHDYLQALDSLRTGWHGPVDSAESEKAVWPRQTPEGHYSFPP